MYIFGFSVRACFRIAVYAFGMNKKRHILVDIGHFSNGTPLNETSFVNIKVLQCENAEKIQKRALSLDSRSGIARSKCLK